MLTLLLIHVNFVFQLHGVKILLNFLKSSVLTNDEDKGTDEISSVLSIIVCIISDLNTITSFRDIEGMNVQ